MFEILFRITDETEYLKSLNGKSFDNGGDIEGFFAINVNGNYYGHYHENLLGDDEDGWYSISTLFIIFVEAYKQLRKSDYVAINDIDSFNTWIEFKREKNLIFVSIVEADKTDGIAELQLTPFYDFNYGKWKLMPIKESEYYDELIIKISLYLNQISRINHKLLSNKNIKKLINCYLELENFMI